LEILPRPFAPARRYTEPDSIPLEIRPEIPSPEIPAAAAPAEAGVEEVEIRSSSIAEAQDDLTVIEGIGPKISALLREAGIVTFNQLAATSPEQLGEILTNARLRRLADPATWQEQARLAATGKWEDLERLQDTLKGGRKTKES